MQIHNFLSKLNGRERVFSLTIVLLFCSTVPFFVIGNNIAAIISGIFIVTIIWLTSPIWRPAGYGKNKIRYFSLIVVAMVALPQFYWSKFLLSAISEYPLPLWMNEVFHSLPNTAPSILVMGFVLIGIFIVNIYTRDKTVMKEAEKSDIEGYTETELRKELEVIKSRLRTDLEEINSNTNWSSKSSHRRPCDQGFDERVSSRERIV
jgi:hypothetical protein